MFSKWYFHVECLHDISTHVNVNITPLFTHSTAIVVASLSHHQNNNDMQMRKVKVLFQFIVAPIVLSLPPGMKRRMMSDKMDEEIFCGNSTWKSERKQQKKLIKLRKLLILILRLYYTQSQNVTPAVAVGGSRRYNSDSQCASGGGAICVVPRRIIFQFSFNAY